MRGWSALLAAAVVLFPVAGMAADPLNTLAVRIENVGTRGGTLHVGVYDAASYGDGSAPVLERTLKPIPGTMTVTFVGIDEGVYAVKAVQDINHNKAQDHHLFGSTAEPVGYSNIVGIANKPPFRAVQFTVSKGDNKVIVRMRE